MRLTHALITAIAVALCTLPASGQGFYLESKRSASDEIERFWYMPHMFRSTDQNGKLTVIRLDREVIYNIDPGTRTYTELPFSEMKAMKDKIAAVVKKRMESMTPEQKKALEGNAAAATAPSEKNTHEVVSTGETKSISGFTCSKFIVKRHDRPAETIWATNDVRGAESLRKDMEKFMEMVSTSLGRGQLGTTWYKEIRGLPIRTEDDGSTTTVTRVDQRSINLSEFEVPAGYTKTKMNGFEDLGQEGRK